MEKSSDGKAEVPLSVEPQANTLHLDFEIVDDSREITEIACAETSPADGSNPGAANMEDDFHRLDTIVRKSHGYFIVAGRALVQIRDRNLWRAVGCSSWADYCQTIGGHLFESEHNGSQKIGWNHHGRREKWLRSG